MFNWLILGHIVFGLIAFVGSLLLRLGFRTSFGQPDSDAAMGDCLSIGGLFATMAFVMFTAANIVPALLFIGAGLALLWILFHQRAKA